MDFLSKNKVSVLHAFHSGEEWSSSLAFIKALESYGFIVKQYNLYHNNGIIDPKTRSCQYTTAGMDQMYSDYSNGSFIPDYVILFDYGVFDHPYLNKSMIPSATWICESGDDPQSFKYNSLKVHKFHYTMTPDYDSYIKYKEMGINALFLTHAADNEIFKPREDIKEEFDCVTTCGDRGETTSFLYRMFGEQFNNQRYFYGTEHGKRLCMGKIVFQKSQYGEITRRIFEGMACGKLVVTDRLSDSKKLHEIFIPDEDIVLYSSPEEAYDKILFYSHNDKERLRIAKNGFEKVTKYHLYKNRVHELMSNI